MKKLIEQNIKQLEQLLSFLQQIDDQLYQEKLKCLLNSSIGMHVRHILEFYECLIKYDKEQAIVNYDKRERNIELENRLSFAIEKINLLLNALNAVPIEDLNLTLQSGIDDLFESHLSSLKRELLYLQEHSTHHMATIKIAVMVHHEGLSIDDDFGVAQSTLQFQKKVSC